MRKLITTTLIGSIFAASSAFAATGTTHGEYGNHCAYGLAHGKVITTDCSINWKSEDGKTFCFSTEEAKANWAKDTVGNTKKASDEYAKVTGGKHTEATEKHS